MVLTFCTASYYCMWPTFFTVSVSSTIALMHYWNNSIYFVKYSLCTKSATLILGREYFLMPMNWSALLSIIRHSGPLHATPSTSQSGEASTSNQPQKDQSLQWPNNQDLSAPQPFISHGPVGSTTSNRDLENSLQKAYENAIRSQIEVIIIFSLRWPALILLRYLWCILNNAYIFGNCQWGCHPL